MASITEAANLAALPRAFSRPEVVSDSSSLRVFEKSKMSRYAARSTRPTARTGRLASAIAVAIRFELLVVTALLSRDRTRRKGKIGRASCRERVCQYV